MAKPAQTERAFLYALHSDQICYDYGQTWYMGTWQVQQAKARLSELIDSAHTEGPQTITRHGIEQAVMISIEEYKRLAAPKADFKEFLLGPPYVDDFVIPRSRDKGRTIRL